MITRRAATAGLATTLIGLSRGTSAQTPPSPPAPVSLKGNGIVSLLEARPTSLRLKSGAAKDAETWTFNGELGGAFSLKHGEELRLLLKNGTSLPLSLNFQGVRGPNSMDGVGGLTQEPVPPGGQYEYRFTPPDPGTFLIRPCVLGGSAEPTERGLTRMLIVEEESPPQVDQDIALLVDDWLLSEDGSLAPFEKTPTGRLGNWLSIGGKATPQRIEAAPGSRIRLRLANASNARAMRLRFDRLSPVVIAIDGQPTGTFEPLKASLPFAPGSRYDLLVDLPREAGATGSVMAMIGGGIPLADIVTTGAARSGPAPELRPLPRNKKLPDAIKLQNATRKDVLIQQAPDGSAAPWTVNGSMGNPSSPLVKVKRGTPVVLTLNNQTSLVQPVHLHGHVFRLLHALDDGWEPYFLDTVQIPENKTIRIAFVADNPGRWLLASMVMERFDAGLWTWIEVA